MRRFLVRNVGLLFPLAILLVLGGLVALQWSRSASIQHVRSATMVAGKEARLLEALADALRDVERTERAFLATGKDVELGAFREAERHLASLSWHLQQQASAEALAGPAPGLPEPDGPDLAVLIAQIHQHQAALDASVALRRSGSMGAAPLARPAGPVLDHVTRAAQAVEESHLSGLKAIGGGIGGFRWAAALMAVLAAIGMLGVLHLFRRAWSGLIRAETEQRLLAMQLRGSLDSLSQGVAVFSADGLLLNWNLRLRELLDLPASLLRRGLSYAALERHLADGGDAFLEPLPATGGDAFGPSDGRPVVYERVVRRAAETQIEIRRTLMPQGGFVLTLTDMTERVQAEQLLHETQKMQALGQLTGGIAHDFNNMLTVILGSLDVSAAELAASGDRRLELVTARMRTALQAAESGAALTRQLLDFARKQPLAPVPVDLARVLPGLVPLLRHSIGEGVGLSFHGEAGLWPAIVDTARLESAVLNLALNARDAMPDGGRLTIEARNTTFDHRDGARHPDLAPGDYVRISVADTGAGMTREIIARAFEPFFSTKPDGRGTGLGLAMVFAFAKQCGGLAMIQSEPGHGSTILLYLPRAFEYPIAANAEMEPAVVGGPDPAHRPHILVVEDDFDLREIAVGTLRELGYQVSEAQDAGEALRQLGPQGAPLDLLLTDLTLPGDTDGRALAAQVRRSSPATRVLYMSGELEDPAETEPAGGPAVRWLSKPFRRAQLADAVGALVEPRRAGQAA